MGKSSQAGSLTADAALTSSISVRLLRGYYKLRTKAVKLATIRCNGRQCAVRKCMARHSCHGNTSAERKKREKRAMRASCSPSITLPAESVRWRELRRHKSQSIAFNTVSTPCLCHLLDPAEGRVGEYRCESTATSSNNCAGPVLLIFFRLDGSNTRDGKPSHRKLVN